LTLIVVPALLLLLLFLPSVNIFPRQFKIEIQNLGTDHQSMQSATGKVSRNKTAM